MLNKKIIIKFIALMALVSMTLLAALLFGSADIGWQAIKQCFFSSCDNAIVQTVIWEIRLPRILVGFVAGMGLALAGAVLQNTTRNPLADPYLFGIVSGAGLGATIATLCLSNELAIALPLAAFLGALLSVVIVLVVAAKFIRVEQLLLAGVAVSFMLGAIAQFLLYLGEPFATNRVLFWLMGSLARVEMHHLWIITPVLLFSIMIVVALARQMDALLLGDDSARSVGVQVNKIRFILLMVCAALTATIVAYCGGIGFVGLMIPHIVRHWFGVTTLRLMLGSLLLGGVFLVWVDVIARSALATQEIPIGVITSAIGSVFFLLVMKQNRQK